MASITFSGSISDDDYYLLIGGIVGGLDSSSSYPVYVKNCANYGSVTHSGVSKDSYIGGIIGQLCGGYSFYIYIYNCLNYGTTTHSGTTLNDLHLGGISGYSDYSTVDNCVSSGLIAIDTSGSGTTYVGSIVGYTALGSTITHCYWNASIGYDGCGYEEYTTITDSYSFDPSSFELAGSASIGNYAGTSLIGALNGAADYYFLRDYSHWALNKDSRNVSFTVNGRAQPSFTTNAQVILLPDLAGEGNMTFSGWYTDSACEDLLADFIIDSDEKKDLYGLWGAFNYTINFDTQGGSALPSITSPYGSTVELPTSTTRSGCSFLNWETEYGDPMANSFTVPSRNITLYAVWLCEHITTARDLIAFSDAVNSGTNFEGTTVFLDSDIDFIDDLSQHFEMIGKDYNYFRGTFDGRGHVVRNLVINASSSYQQVGLFGYSTGTTIKNAVIDETCSFVNNYDPNGDSDDAYTGSIIGKCRTDEGPCTLENNVNMAGVTFDGNAGGESFTGGITGILASSNYQATIKNCANYGAVSSTEKSGGNANIGGIAGSSQKSSTYYIYVQNCVNYGTITHSGTTSNELHIGAIAGYSYYSTIDNCVNSAPIVIESSGSSKTFVGSIAGAALYSTTITHCYWNASIEYDVCGYKYSSTIITDSYPFNPSSFELAGSVSIGNYAGTSLIGALNGAADYYILHDYSHWALNKDGRNVSFTVNGRAQSSFTTNAQVILLPDLAGGENMSFSGWYIDSACTVPLADFIIDSDEKKGLYGLWGAFNYTINFDTQGGSALPSITSPYGSAVELKNATRSGCVFLNWETEYGYPVANSITVPSRNITLYAVWLCERITTARDLIAFSDAVNSGTSFKGTTVYLGSDIDFTDGLSQQFEMIGKDANNPFRGTFDGRGHVVRNLVINASSSYRYVGLFGYSTGTTIRNAVIDETCSFTNNFISSDYDTCTGSIIGYCYACYGSCALESNMNMADITFNGSASIPFTGGITGILLSSNNQATIKNCANYGTISSTGTSKNDACLGGIVGSSQKSSSTSSNAYVQNCANYGTVHYNGSSNGINIGGISGLSDYNIIDNCVSSGPVAVDSSSSSRKYVGNVVGRAASSATITHCYWTLDVGCNGITGLSDDSVTVTETTYVERLNTTTLDELNSYVASHKLDGFSQWVMLRLNGGSVSNLTQSDLVVAQEHFPSPVKESNTFLRWCKDLECGEVYDNDLTDVTALYAVWETVRVTFTFWNGTTAGAVSVEYGTAYGALPAAGAVVEGHTLCWFISNGDDDDERVVTPETNVTTTSDHTLHGRCVANNYTVSLDLGNGTVITRTLQYNESISLPQEIAREGCTHTGWDNSNTTTNMPAKNITINALWDCNHNAHSSSSGKSKSSSNTGAIVGGVVGGLVGVILIVLAVLMLLMFHKNKEEPTRRKRRDGIEMKGKNSRIVEKSPNASEADCCDDNSSSVLSESLSKLYPEPYRAPTIAEALYMAGLDEVNIAYIDEACTLTGKHAANEGVLFDGFGKDAAAAVALYTFDFGGDDYEINPYRIINKALVSRNDDDLKKASGLLYLVLSALRKLPKFAGRKLYRGIRGDVDVSSYKKGRTVVWHGLSSTSPDMSATKAFLANNAVNKKGTLFVIDNGWGYDVQPYSLFPEEAEILLEPERRFRVQSVIEAELTVINLEMMDTPVILPEVFGEK